MLHETSIIILGSTCEFANDPARSKLLQFHRLCPSYKNLCYDLKMKAVTCASKSSCVPYFFLAKGNVPDQSLMLKVAGFSDVSKLIQLLDSAVVKKLSIRALYRISDGWLAGRVKKSVVRTFAHPYLTHNLKILRVKETLLT